MSKLSLVVAAFFAVSASAHEGHEHPAAAKGSPELERMAALAGTWKGHMIDKDGKPDLLLAGNDYATEIESGRNDAGIGLVLKNKGGNRFGPLTVKQSGFYVPGDVKCMKKITVNNKPCILIGKNQGDLQVIGRTEP